MNKFHGIDIHSLVLYIHKQKQLTVHQDKAAASSNSAFWYRI